MSARFAVGQRVRVRRAFPPGHVRTPAYVRGKAGVIEDLAGHFANPEELAYGRDGLPRQALYRVRFRQSRAVARLRRVRPPTARSRTCSSTGSNRWRTPDHDGRGARIIIIMITRIPHPHPRQPDLEDQPFDHYQLLAEAVGELLIEKGVFAAADLRRTIEAIDARSPADGARLVARAWQDSAFKARLLEDANAAARELGIEAGAIPVRALENTSALHNLVTCTLCSCYPRGLLGLPPDWYKARAYRCAGDPRAARGPGRVRHGDPGRGRDPGP